MGNANGRVEEGHSLDIIERVGNFLIDRYFGIFSTLGLDFFLNDLIDPIVFFRKKWFASI